MPIDVSGERIAETHSAEEVVWGKKLGKWLERRIELQELETKTNVSDIVAATGVGRGSRILDIGVGPLARFSISFTERGSSVVSVDISGKVLRSAREKIKAKNLTTLGFVQADAMHLPFRNGYFDLAFCYGTLFHMPSNKGVHLTLSEMSRVVHRDGFVYADLQNILNPVNWTWIFGRALYTLLRQAITPHTYITYGFLQDSLKRNRLKIIRLTTKFELWSPLFVIPLFSSIILFVDKGWELTRRRISEISRGRPFLRFFGSSWVFTARIM